MSRFCLFLLSLGVLSANPLLKFTTPIPWDQIQPAHIQPAIDQHLKDAEARRTSYLAQTAKPTWDNTIEARERIAEDLTQSWGLVAHLQSVNNTAELRKEFNATQPRLTAFLNALGLDSGIYERVKAYAATNEAKSLTGPKKRVLELILADYRRSGVTLDAAKRARVLELRQKLSQLSTQFAQNALDSTNAFELLVTDESQLAGLPEINRAAASRAAAGKGYRFTLQAPSMIPVLTYADSSEIREKISRAQTAIASSGKFDNRPVIEQILGLRRELANLLGYQTFADFQSELRMARSGRAIQTFLAGLEGKTRDAFDTEVATLQAFSGTKTLRAWDTAYYTQKLRQKEFQFDQNELRPYFELSRVLGGLWGLVHELYGIRVTELKDTPVWNPQVRAFRIDDADGTQLATFYADFFPRESKRAGAWCNSFYIGYHDAKTRVPHIGTIVSNITPPGADGKALLTHAEVQTVFHEFGHLLHLAFREGPLRALNTTQVPWDFVELPSQIMENFTWERSVLSRFAVHDTTGEALPDALFDKMTRSRTFMAASAQMRQLSLGTMDIQLHTDYKLDGDYGEPVSYVRKIAQRFSAAPLEPEACPICAFSHVFAGGYAAGYYSYKWAEVLDADAFSKFKANGVISRKTGDEFRTKLLAPGNAKPADILFRDFMGRNPDPSALLRRIGLVPSARK